MTDSLRELTLSAVVTCYKDEQAILPMHRRLSQVLSSLGVKYGTIFVNDGSPDAADPVLRELTTADNQVLAIEHSSGPLTRLPVGQIPRHVVAISSLANYVGNPYSLGYFTSKRALTACFEVWSKMYAGTDLIFQQVMLGPVPTAIYTMDDRAPPWMVRVRDSSCGSLDGTARAISRLVVTRRKKLFYPCKAVPLYWGTWLGQRLILGFLQGRKTLEGNARRKRVPQRTGEGHLSVEHERVGRRGATDGQG